MNVTVNGESLRLDHPTTLSDLIARLSVSGRYAVEVNGEIVTKSAHPTHHVKDGDKIEIVQAIGGG